MWNDSCDRELSVEKLQKVQHHAAGPTSDAMILIGHYSASDGLALGVMVGFELPVRTFG